MPSSQRRSFLPSSAWSLLVFAATAACSSNSASAVVDASADGDDPPDAKKVVDAGHDAKSKLPPTDGGSSSGACLCDAGMGSEGHARSTSGSLSASSGSSASHSSSGSSGAPHDGGHAPALGVHTTGVTIPVKTATGTVNRTYDVTLPATCDSSHRVPLVFAFHGDGGKGADMYSGFPIEAAAHAAGGEAIFVYPDGTDDNIDDTGAARAWDLYHDPGPYPYTAGDPVPADNDAPAGNKDIDFFDAMVATFEQKYCADPSKVFITGMSSGGYLSNQFARWRSKVVKGTAPQSGGAPFGNNDGNTSTGGDWTGPNYCVGPTSKVPALIIHGESDGTVDPCNAIEAQSYWDLTNGCSDSANNCTTTADSCTGSNLASPSPAPTSTSSLNSLCVATGGCGANPVVLCRIPGMGHSIWADAPAVIWGFFASL